MGGVLKLPLQNKKTIGAGILEDDSVSVGDVVTAVKKHYMALNLATPTAADTFLGGEAACFMPGEAITITKLGVTWRSTGTAVSELDAYLVKKNAAGTTSVALSATGTTTVATYQTNSATTAISIAETEGFYLKVPTVTTASMVTAVIEFTKG